MSKQCGRSTQSLQDPGHVDQSLQTELIVNFPNIFYDFFFLSLSFLYSAFPNSFKSIPYFSFFLLYFPSHTPLVIILKFEGRHIMAKAKSKSTLKFVFGFLLKRDYPKRKAFAPFGSKCFPFRVDPFSERIQCAGQQTGNYKSCLPCKNCGKLTKCIKSKFISFIHHNYGTLNIPRCSQMLREHLIPR